MKVMLKKDRSRPVERGSAWVFSGAVASVEGEGPAGSVADVFDVRGRWLGRGLWCGREEDLCVRVLERREGVALDGAWLAGKVAAAAGRRYGLAGAPATWRETTGWRMVFSEADGLSGLVVDRFGEVAVAQVGSAGWDGREGAIREAVLGAMEGVERVVFERAEGNGAPGAASGEGCGEAVWFRESGAEFSVVPGAGQKTGFYLDQRDNRVRVAALAKGRRMLSCYCYTGGFEVLAARAGAASVEGWDSSAPALAAAERHLERNGLAGAVRYEVADVPRRLRLARDRGESWDLIVLDPPRLVHSRGGLERGLRAYKDINLLALKLLSPGGVLATFSCSGLVDAATFRCAAGWAAADSGRSVQVIGEMGQPFDHPRLAGSEECDYLKGLLLRAD